MPTTTQGTLYGLGVGPGDPELVTLKTVRLARAADVLAYPAPEQGESRARAIMATHLTGQQTEIAIRMPMAAERFPALEVYDRAAEELGSHLDAGRNVAVLCLGDPLLYGSFMYLLARLAGAYPVIVVPGVTSIAAAAAAVPLALASRDDSLLVVPATLDDAVLAARLAGTDAAVIVKLGRHLARVKRVLAGAGLIDRAHYVERASTPAARVAPLSTVGDAAAPYFSLVLVHRRGQAWK